MASFFQPNSFGTTIQECGSTRFAIYCNSIVPAARRFRQWHQTADLVVGSVAVAVPLLLWLFLFVARGGLWRLVKACR